MQSLTLGVRGYFGVCSTSEGNLKVSEINKLIDDYNSSINLFNTREEQIIFENNINSEIDKIIKTL